MMYMCLSSVIITNIIIKNLAAYITSKIIMNILNIACPKLSTIVIIFSIGE